VKFGHFYELQLPKPYDSDTWDPDDERRVIQEMLEQVGLADQFGFDYIFQVEHHFLEEYSHSSAPEVVLAAASQRTNRIRLGHGIVHMPPGHNHPACTAERVATLDLVSNGRVEFGTGEGASDMELGGFGTDRSLKKQMWEESTRECLRMMTSEPYAGVDGHCVGMPVRNVIPKPLQKPHPPVWVAASRRETVMLAARLGIGSLGFGFETPEEACERIPRHYELVREECRPIGAAINPAVATVVTMMCCRTDEEAGRRGSPARSSSHSRSAGARRPTRRATLAATICIGSSSTRAGRGPTASARPRCAIRSRRMRASAPSTAPAGAAASSARPASSATTCVATRRRTWTR
jgi:alkanesulfonate monooxygenase SsuD/methylene tetrahydromethanopterin reductase-like flavin-dependent oxidoreductase (luciferase family)